MCVSHSIRKIQQQPHFQHQYPRYSVESTDITVELISPDEIASLKTPGSVFSTLTRTSLLEKDAAVECF